MRTITSGFLVFITLFLGAELVIRFGFIKTMEGRFDYGYHPTAGFDETDDGKVELLRTGGRRFFPQTFSKEKPAGVYRILVIGDSVSRGKSVEESYSGQIQTLLREQGIQAESVNFSLPGYGARRKNVVLKQALKYRPDLVILHIGTSNEYEDEREWRRKMDFNPAHPQNWLMNSLLLRQLYEVKMEKIYWQWLPTAVRNQEGIFDVNAELRASTDENTQKAWTALVEKATREALQFTESAHVPTVLVTQATRKNLPGGAVALDDSQVNTLTSGLIGENVARVPMKSVIPPDQIKALYLDANHVRRPAHLLLAQAIVQAVKDKGWLPPPAQK